MIYESDFGEIYAVFGTYKAKKCEKHKKYLNWFNPAITKPNCVTRKEKPETKYKYTPVPFRKERFRRSPIPFLTQILNDHYSKKKK